MADVGFNISGIPGPPFGPTYLITTTFPFFTFPSFIPLLASFSESNTIAFPVNIKPSFPVILATEPSEAIFP